MLETDCESGDGLRWWGGGRERGGQQGDSRGLRCIWGDDSMTSGQGWKQHMHQQHMRVRGRGGGGGRGGGEGGGRG